MFWFQSEIYLRILNSSKSQWGAIWVSLPYLSELNDPFYVLRFIGLTIVSYEMVKVSPYFWQDFHSQATLGAKQNLCSNISQEIV